MIKHLVVLKRVLWQNVLSSGRHLSFFRNRTKTGFAYRWIRVSTLNTADPRNISAKLREGWEPVKLEEQPKFQLLIDPDSRFKDQIEVGGLLLCKTPIELVEQRNAYYQKQSESQIQSVDNNLMRQNDPRMPLFKESKSTVSKAG